MPFAQLEQMSKQMHEQMSAALAQMRQTQQYAAGAARHGRR
jgi:hypothetical protein